jgi:ribose 5-phosphate isomerase B
MELNTLYIGGDHAGFDVKQKLIKYLNKNRAFDIVDKGTYSDESTDYPEYAHAVAESVAKASDSLGILICGSGNGVCMTANKHKGIRAGLVWEKELAELTRQHNNANIICLPARFISYRKMIAIVNAFLDTPFEGGRHQRRVDKIPC